MFESRVCCHIVGVFEPFVGFIAAGRVTFRKSSRLCRIFEPSNGDLVHRSLQYSGARSPARGCDKLRTPMNGAGEWRTSDARGFFEAPG